MQIYKPKDSKGQTRRKWYITFYHLDKRRRVAVSTNLKATEKIATAVDGMLACNGSLTPDLQVFVETMNPALRTKLISFGVIGRQYKPSIHAGKTTQDHIREWGESLKAKDNCPKYANQVERSVRKIFDKCVFHSLSDIDANRLYLHLADHRGDDGYGQRYFNSLLQSCKQFCKWTVREQRTKTNPLEHLDFITQTEKRHQRRALTLDEQKRLIEAAANGTRHHYMTGPQRALLYRTALQTGLRLNEIKNLTVSSLDVQDRTLTLTAAYTKNKKLAVQPLTKPLTADLQAFTAGKLPGAKMFTIPNKPVPMLRVDLIAAGIEYKTDEGIADFHSCRHSYITNLAKAGVHPSDAMVLARHSSITMTMNFYTHSHRESLQKIVDAQPDLTKKVPKECPKCA